MGISEPEISNFPGTPTVVVRRADLPVSDLVQFMDESFTALGEAVRACKFIPAGPGFSRYDTPLSSIVTLEVGFPVEKKFDEFLKIGEVTIQGSELPAGSTMVTKYNGGYDGLSEAWGDFISKITDRGYEATYPYWEAYDTMPAPGIPESELITGLAAPVKRG